MSSRKTPLRKAERAVAETYVGRVFYDPPFDSAWARPHATLTWVLSIGPYTLRCRWADPEHMVWYDGGARDARGFMADHLAGRRYVAEVAPPAVGDVVTWAGVFGGRHVYRVAPAGLEWLPEGEASYVPALPVLP